MPSCATGARAAQPTVEPSQVYGNIQIELVWTVVPLLIDIVVLVTARWASSGRPQPVNALEISIIGINGEEIRSRRSASSR